MLLRKILREYCIQEENPILLEQWDVPRNVPLTPECVSYGRRGDNADMIMEQSLLDFLAIQMKCEYLSDLHFLSQVQRWYLAQKLDRLTPQEADVREWNDALTYLTGAPPETNAQAAKERLVKLLSKDDLKNETEREISE